MLRNVLDVDFAAQKISISSRRGAIVLFGFKVAFPSLSHDYMWEVVVAIGLRACYVDALRLFYTGNKHWIRIGRCIFESVDVRSGVRQGCPLSPLQFVLCADIVFRRIFLHSGAGELVRAFADDTAVVVSDYTISFPCIGRAFLEYASISGLQLNVELLRRKDPT
ncbi:unnamed protein product [Prorocentrum cordatum]|uniref:Reverse transcriptase domain-containing protein n=1 Tax=Prorocentrum cordatum TaxID=2364126 RepID=A0ABN9X9K3_9DINO|nr:unnamed protein product [Polarella glacialis]